MVPIGTTTLGILNALQKKLKLCVIDESFVKIDKTKSFVKIHTHHAREIQKVDLHCTVWQVPVSSLPSRVTAR